MATNTTVEILETQNRNYNTNPNEINREDVQIAIAKAKELRALHSALVQGNYSPANLRFLPSGSSPVPHQLSQFSAHDYPVFTPSYEDEPLPGYQQIQLESQTLSECWNEYKIGGGNIDETILSDHKMMNASSRNGFPNLESHICPAEDQKSIGGSFSRNALFPIDSPGNDFSSSRRNSLAEFRYLSSSCNKCNPAVISKDSNIVVPLTDSHYSLQPQPKARGLIFSRLLPFSRLKKKNKNVNSPSRMDTEERVSQGFKHLGILSIEVLKKELMEANESRDAALMEVAEMKSSMGELEQKLEHLETYCVELKQALRQATQTKENDSQVLETHGNLNSINDMPVSEEVMVEGFLQVVSEARLSVKQYSKTLITQIDETDGTLMDNLNSLLQPYKLSLNSKYTKAVLYHLEAIINQTLYQDFENTVFQKNGSPKLLDPHQDRQVQFQSFVFLRNLSWNEVLRKGTKHYSEEFSKFCDQKMSCIISALNWARPWPENLLHSFFVAAKCIWLLHLLAFSFNPPLGILRVEENRSFDSHFMEDVFMDRRRSSDPSRVKLMVMPGFYVQERVLRCKVLCRYKSVT